MRARARGVFLENLFDGLWRRVSTGKVRKFQVTGSLDMGGLIVSDWSAIRKLAPKAFWEAWHPTLIGSMSTRTKFGCSLLEGLFPFAPFELRSAVMPAKLHGASICLPAGGKIGPYEIFAPIGRAAWAVRVFCEIQ
jgi:hypothetical protein